MSVINKLLPPISKEFADQLDKSFRPITIIAGIDRDEIMISVGERRVVEWIMKNSHQRVIAGTPEVLADNPGMPTVETLAGKTKEPKTLWGLFNNRYAED